MESDDAPGESLSLVVERKHFLEGHRGRIEDCGARPRELEEGGIHQGARVHHEVGFPEKTSALQGDELGVARTCPHYPDLHRDLPALAMTRDR